jgi:hypothetical protein
MIGNRYFFQFLLFSFAVLLSFAAGLRGGYDPDFEAYFHIYENYSIIFGLEPLFFSVFAFSDSLDFSFRFVIFLIAFVSVFLKYRVISKYFVFPIFCFLYFSFSWFLVYDSIAIRQGVAIGFVALFFFTGSYWRYFFALFAFASHYSAIVPIISFVAVPFLASMSFFYQCLLLVFILGASRLGLFYDFMLFWGSGSFLDSLGLSGKLTLYLNRLDFSYPWKSLVIYFVTVASFQFFPTSLRSRYVLTFYYIGLVWAAFFSNLPEFAFRFRSYFFFFEPYLLALVCVFVIRSLRLPKSFIFYFFAILLLFQSFSAVRFLNSLSARGYQLDLFGYVF